MLRDILTRFPGVETWPCDEINYIWRYGNRYYPSDVYNSSLVTEPIRQYIRRQFQWVAQHYNAHTVVEKTCANSLRINFVDCIVPDARYIFIRRNGIDAAASAMKRWNANLDIPYLLRKARFIPPSDMPYYLFRFLGNRLHLLFTGKERRVLWGPRIDNMAELLKQHSLQEVCALQWQQCVDSAYNTLKSFDKDRWIEVGYEDFVHYPEKHLNQLMDFLNLTVSPSQREEAVHDVRVDSIGKGFTAIGENNIKRLMPLIEKTMARHGYV